MRRREFITLLSGAAATWPLVVRAQQQSAMPVVGFLGSGSPAESSELITAFLKALHQMGFVEGQNLIIAFRWAEGHYEKLPGLASALVGLRPAVIFTGGGAVSARAAKAATSTIPIVFSASDPVHFGLVSSLNQPGGNITGISPVTTELAGKQLGLLKQTVPRAETIGYLVNPSSPAAPIFLKETRAAATTLGTELHPVDASTPTDLDEAFATLAKVGVGALTVMADPFFDTQRARIIELSARYRTAGCYPWRDFALAGGLMSYGTNRADLYRQGGIYVGRILQGENPSNLPVMQPTKFEFVLNLKTAKAPPGFFPLRMR
jgi:putative ABC transport system substrate-binding protein